MPAQLIAINEGENILLDKPILLVGRHPECDIQIESRKISRRHCCIAQVDDYLVIRDLGSTNGIRLNGERVTEAKVHPSDEVTIGNTKYRVSWDSAVQNNQRNLPNPPAASPVAGAPVPPPPPPPVPSAAPVPAAAGPTPPRPGDPQDSWLESADEPVALEEPGGMNAQQPRQALPAKPVESEPEPSPPPPPIEEATDPRTALELSDEIDPLTPALSEPSEEILLPEDLELAPLSDEFKVPPPPPPPGQG